MPTTVFPNMTAKDWLRILEKQLHQEALFKKKIQNQDIINWASQHCENISSFTTTEISNLRRRKKQLTEKQGELIKQIGGNVSAAAVARHLAALRFRSLCYFDTKWSSQHELKGIYIARRLSFSNPGQVNVSAFLFGRDKENRPFFKEKRKIDVSGNRYQIRTQGFWFHDRRGYSMHGMSYEIPVGTRARDCKLKDVKHRYDDHYYFNDDTNSNVVRGIVPYIIKESGFASVTEIVLSNNEEFSISTGHWDKIEDMGLIGVRDPNEGEIEKLRLSEHHPDYLMPVIRNRR